jgi:predicted flap endonuclease-1-like 5' DNA nuclease
MSPPPDDDLQALERARSRLAARLDTSGTLLPAVVRRPSAMDLALRAAVEKIDEALVLLREVPSGERTDASPASTADTFRTVLRAKNNSTLSSLIPTLQPVEARDDLTMIRGINESVARQLAAIGVTRYRQIAEWHAEDVRQVSHALDLGRAISQQNWIEQATLLAAGSPKTTRLEPIEPRVQAGQDQSAGVATVGLDDILSHIRATAKHIAPPVRPMPLPSGPIHMAREAGTSAYGSIHPAPVTPDPAPLQAAAPATATVHEDASLRLAALERELHALGQSEPTAANAATSPGAPLQPNAPVAASGTLPDRSLATTNHNLVVATPSAPDAEEADVIIVTTTRRSSPLTAAPPTPLQPARLALPHFRPTQTPAAAARPTAIAPPEATADVDEATVVIVRQPNAAKIIPELPFFQSAADPQPDDERSVQKFLKALHGE